MELVDAGTCAASSTVSRGDKLWRSTCWAIMNHTATAGTATFKDKDGATLQVISIPAANSTYIYVYGTFAQMTAASVQIDYMVFV